MPRRTASPPSALYGVAVARMQPLAASVSRLSQVAVEENASVVRTPPGAAENSSTACRLAVPLAHVPLGQPLREAGRVHGVHAAVEQPGRGPARP